LKVGEVAAMIAQAELVPLRYFNGAVYIVGPQDAARYEDLGGRGSYIIGPAGERPSTRKLGPCPSYRHLMPPSVQPGAPIPSRPRVCPLCRGEHASCQFARGSLYCVVLDCTNPHHRQYEAP
jgi:hypothetical protein